MSCAFLNKNVFKCFLKVFKFLAVLIARGSLFHLDGPAKANARSPKVLHLARGTSNKVRSLDLKELLIDAFSLMRSQI